MKTRYVAGIAVGIVILLLSVPLGDWYGSIYLILCGGMETERYLMLTQSAIHGFQMIGALVGLLSGIAGIFGKDEN